MPSAINGDSLYFPRSFVCENELDSVWKLRVTSCCKLKKKRKKERENRDNSPIRPRFLFPPLLARIIVDLRHRFCQRPRARAHVALSEQENKTDLSQRDALSSPVAGGCISYAVRVSGRRYATLFSVILSQPPTRLPSGGASRCAGSNRCSSRRLEFLCHARVSLSFSRLFLSNPARDSCCNCNIRTPRRGFHSRTPVKACPTSSSESVKRQTARKVISAFSPPLHFSSLFLYFAATDVSISRRAANR